MELPNMIVGIGGAGKELTFSLLDREWVLKELMKSSDTSVLIVDTAKDDTNRDNEKIHQIEINKISIQKEFRETHREYNNIDIKYIPITEKFYLGSEVDICGKEIIEDVRKIGIKNWWFNLDCYSEETRRIINEEEGFRGISFAAGVVRKRALGKAVFFRALSNGLDIPRPTPAKVAMIVGLGGGTGSGMFIDFAKKLKEGGQCDVVLFGILPTTRETPRERANAYAALCELERLTLDEGREVFKDVVLIPLEPTGYAGSGGVEDEEAQILLREFSEAFPYIFMSYYHISGNRDLTENSSGKRDEYAPFVIASPRVVRYDVEIRKKIADSYAEALKAKKEAFTLCEEINQKVEQFLNEHQFSPGERVKDDYDFVENRLNDFKNWLKQSEFLSKLGYSSPEEFCRVLEDVERELEEKKEELNVNVYDEVNELKSQIDDALKELKECKDEIEKLFNEVVSKEINEIHSLQDLLRRSNSIEDFDVKRIVKQMIRKESSRVGDKTILERKLEELSKELSDNENEIKNLEEELNNVERYTSEKIDNFKSRIKSLTSKDLNELYEIDSEDFRRRIEGCRDNLIKDLEEIAREIEYLDNLIKKEKDLEKIMREIEDIFRYFFDKLDRILSELSRIVGRIDPDIDTRVRAIIESVEMLKRYVEAWAVATSKPGFIDTLICKITGRKTPRMKEIEEAEMTAVNIAGEISKLGVFSVKGLSVEVVFSYPLDEKLEEYRNKLLQMVVEKVKEAYEKFGYELEDDLTNELKKSIKNGRFDEIIEDIAKKALKYDEKKKELKNKIRNTRDTIEKLKRDISIVDSVKKLYEELRGEIGRYREVNGDYMNKMEEFNNLARGHVKNGGLHNGKRIVVEIAPEDRRTTIGRNNIEELLRASEGEKEHLASELRRIVEEMVQSKRFCGLVRRSFENVKGDRRWTAKQVQLYISSIANLRGLSKRLNLQEYFVTSYTGVAPLKVGDKWDVGLTLFIGGVMLDNIAFVDNYYEAYETRTKQLKGAAFLHHAYALEDGSYFVRKPISIEGDEREIFFRNDAESEIKMRYEEKSWRERDCHEAEAG